jgi:hypothetical protein
MNLKWFGNYFSTSFQVKIETITDENAAEYGLIKELVLSKGFG